jgi:hypothetical protein
MRASPFDFAQGEALRHDRDPTILTLSEVEG